MPCEIATANTCNAFFNESFTCRGKVTCVMRCFFLFFFAVIVHRTNDPTSTTETIISLRNAIDYAPYLFTFNIVVNIRTELTKRFCVTAQDSDTYGRAETTKLKKSAVNTCTTS